MVVYDLNGNNLSAPLSSAETWWQLFLPTPIFCYGCFSKRLKARQLSLSAILGGWIFITLAFYSIIIIRVRECFIWPN